MITFKEFLFEKKMAPTSFASTFRRLEDGAKIGFEIEVFVPSGTFLQSDGDVSAKTVALKDLTWINIQSYFDVSKQQEAAIMEDFGAWKAEKEDDWVDENWQDFVDEDSQTAEKGARKIALTRARNRFTFEQWLKSLGSIADFIQSYELEPYYGWADDENVFIEKGSEATYMTGFKTVATALAAELTTALKEKVVVNGTGYQFWNLTHDTSIKDSEGRSDEEDQEGHGVEIVSPPQPPSKALEQLEIVFNLLAKHQIETNESTGIHVNISLQNMEQLDPLKLVLFMGDEHILKKFNRSANTFTNSQIRRVVDSISATGKIPKAVDELIALGREGLEETGKHFSVNLRHLPKYLEFRAAGGADYHKRLHDIRDVTGRWLSAVEIASKPDMYRKEYLKKVMKLIDKTGPGVAKEEASRMSFNEYLKKKQKMFWDQIEDARADGGPNAQSARTLALASLFHELGSDLDHIAPISFLWMKEAQSLFRSMGVSSEDVLNAGRSNLGKTRIRRALDAFKLTKPS